jgi:aspartyl-tRNA(Asn)/glutamyl-tRNA(Gln) amidotransferase subunit C
VQEWNQRFRVVSKLSLSREETARLADLARLRLNDDELSRIAHDLAEIIDYMEKLAGLDRADVLPMSHVLDTVNVYRDDCAQPSLSQEEALSNAPDRQGEFFRVPRIIDTGEGSEA